METVSSYFSHGNSVAGSPPMQSKRINVILGNGVLALGILGFPIVASITVILSFQGNGLSIAYRIAYLIICSALLLRSLLARQYRIDLLISIFLFIYTWRIGYDYLYSNLPKIDEDTQFYVATVLLPVLCIGGGRKWYDENTALLWLLFVGVVGNLLVVYALRTNAAYFSSNPNIEVQAALTTLNPITMGYNGIITASAATMIMLRTRNLLWRAFLVFSILLSIYLTVTAAARGPIVALFCGMAVMGLTNRRASVGFISASLIAAVVVNFTGLPDIVFDRFSSAGTDRSSLERVEAITLAIKEASDNLLFGYAYIEPVTGLYPHNLLVESALAIGIVGLLLMGWMLMSMLFNSLRSAFRGEMLMPFLAITQFVNAWLSASLWTSVAFYVMLWIIRDHRSGANKAPATLA